MTPLRQKLIDEIDLRGLSPCTKANYVQAIHRLARHFKRPPDQISDDELKQYLLYLLRDRKYAASSMIVTVCALRFFYEHVLQRSATAIEKMLPQMKRPVRRPRVYSVAEIERLLNARGLNLKHRVLLMTAYGAGLRVSEVCRLKPADVLSARMQLRIEQGKGQKDRFVPLSPRLLEALRHYWRCSRPRHWLFPNRGNVTKHLTSRSAERIFLRALRLVGLANYRGIHSLRHSFATHMLEAGVDLPSLQRTLGHRSLATTSLYLHIGQAHLTQIRSPLDQMNVAFTAATT